MKPKGRVDIFGAECGIKVESKMEPKLLQMLTFQVLASYKDPRGRPGGPSPPDAPIHGVVFWVDFCSENVPKSDKKGEGFCAHPLRAFLLNFGSKFGGFWVTF